MSKKLNIVFQSTFSEISELNPSFDKGVLRVAYHGLNRNNSKIAKEVFEKAIPSAFNCPVVGNYQRNKQDSEGDNGDFGGHDTHIEIRGGSVDLVNDTYPIGVVPESAKFWWEEVEDETGVHEYLNVDCLLWKRQDAYKKVKDVKTFNQSMEIDVVVGGFDTDGTYKIDEFNFEAFCILSNSLEPCFESANLQVFSKEKTFKEQCDEMYKDFKACFSKNEPEVVEPVVEPIVEPTTTEQFQNDEGNTSSQNEGEISNINPSEGVINLADLQNNVTEPVVEPTAPVVEPTTAPIVEPTVEPTGDFTAEPTVEPIVEPTTEPVVEPVVEPTATGEFTNNATTAPVVEPKSDKYELKFELSHNDLRTKLYELLNPIGEDGYRTYNYWIMEVFDTYCLVEDSNTYSNYYKVSYTKNEKDEVFIGEKVEVFGMWLTADEKAQLEAIRNNYSLLENEVTTLREYKSNAEKVEADNAVKEVFAKFADTLTEEEIAPLKEKANAMDLEMLETSLFALVGKKNKTFSKKPTIAVDNTTIPVVESNPEVKPYGSISRLFNK